MNRLKSECTSGEFVALMAMMMSLVALGIDAMLPALSVIGEDLAVPHPNDVQMVVSMLFVGLVAGTLVYGPISDAVGRKPVIYFGITSFLIGSVVSMVAETFDVMLMGRVLQGFGAASPRVVTLALVRDKYSGAPMAKIMSQIMAVFIIVPALAPALGQVILHFFNWRAIFGSLLTVGTICFIWFAMRQPETLVPEKRTAFSIRHIFHALSETLRNRTACGYTVTGGVMFGSFIGYLNSSQQVFQEHFEVGDLFPVYFGTLALAVGAASYTNSKLVLRYGMRPLCWRALLAICGLSVGYFLYAYMQAGSPPLWTFMAYMLAAFFFIGILFGNFNSMAIEPLGHIAGVASAVIGSLQSAISVSLGVVIGRAFDGTVLPLLGSFLALGLISLSLMFWVERPKQIR